MRLAVEHIDVDTRRLAVHQQAHADLFHTLEDAEDLGDIAHAGVRVRGAPAGYNFTP